MADNQQPPTLVSEMLQAKMDEQNLSIRDVAEKLDVTYEHVRKVVKGDAVPGKPMLRPLSELLKLSLKALESAATADRIRLKFGVIPLELSGKNPELEPIERSWEHLSQQHKNDLIVMAATFAKLDRARARN